MILQALHCPHCQGTDIVRHGTTRQGKQRYRCRLCREGRGRTFLLDYAYTGHSAEVKQQIVEIAMNASGIRDTARVLQSQSHYCHQRTQKKEPELQSVNHALLAILNPEHVEVEIWREDELAKHRGLNSELDEMWSYVQRKSALALACH